MTFDPFVLPFSIGLLVLLIMLGVKFIRWIKALPAEDSKRASQSFFTRKSLKALEEVFLESLIHRSMFRQNKMLGFMHMSFAFGWFMLILIGNIESRVISGAHINPPYYPIFMRFFFHDQRILPFEQILIPGFFRFTMDLFLLLVLSGLVLALFKRVRSKWFGLRKATTQLPLDRIALTTLWFIFPLRFLAESFTAATWHSGSFLTNSMGYFLRDFLPEAPLAYVSWWLYSLSLGVFFVTLPFSRYMHIPAEILLIFLRNYGISTSKELSSFSEIEINSCPRCGVCIDQCQLNSETGNSGVMPLNFLRSLRTKQSDTKAVFDCLVCGRCQEVCPVGIGINAVRTAQRNAETTYSSPDFSYLPHKNIPQTDVLYFAGCMTHLTPSIKKAMVKILDHSGDNYRFMDADGTICCGRPLMLAGKPEEARELMLRNKHEIESSGAKTLVTSCPICLKIFRDEYQLNINIIHHSQYIAQLIEDRKIELSKTEQILTYHDPCELSRGCNITEEAREVLQKTGTLSEIHENRNQSLCCGGSLGSIGLSAHDRKKITQSVLTQFYSTKAEILVTSCPLCKKTFAGESEIPVKDLSEIVSASLLSGISAKKDVEIQKKESYATTV